ncbi:USP6 N-terminal-like protein isoform X2 [Neocloeon triangulifer]|uniref:USP6 N-terminal-like protein isoform X2 n=1 Tax=Neocloeon triangulifer TaxID=2078957 RepID=UPI00286F81EC|nr:USP6 N-terminal-like protein isoform X2 [Neocloeon triangulifer]
MSAEEEAELQQRALEERQSIVRRYKIGRSTHSNIDPWEDPDFELYSVKDKYGFLHQKTLPKVKDANEKKQAHVQVEREKKWNKMTSGYNWKQFRTSDKLRKRIFKGIPESFRSRVWGLLLNLDSLKQEQKGKYEEMRELAHQWSPDIRQIDLDVNRTYRDHVDFRERYSDRQKSLFNVLGAYSMYNLEIGYCQGMSQIVALLLMYLDEEESFWALSVLVSDQRFAMHGFFIPGFPKLLRYQEHHDKIMKKFLPKLKRHLDKNGVDTGIYTLKWFFQCFLDRIPFSLTLRVWDVYMLEGERVLTAMAYTLLKMHRKTLLKLGMDEILQFLQVRLEHEFGFDDDTVMLNLKECLDELKKGKLDFAGSPPSHELPQKPFGLFHPPPIQQQVGRRTDFSRVEAAARDNVISRRDAAIAEAAAAPESPTSGDERHGSRASADEGSANYSFEPEETSSVLGSRRSLAETSVTSTADLSVFSNATTAGGSASRASQDNCSVTSEHAVAPKTHRRLPSADSVTHFGSGRSTPKASLSGDHLHPSTIESLRKATESGSRHSPTMTRRLSAHENGSVSLRSSPRPSRGSSKDVVRIFVPAPQNGELAPVPPPPPPRQLILKTGDPNKIKIKVPDPLEDRTPLVEHGRLVISPSNGVSPPLLQ